jgi:putative membrane protein
VSDEAGRTGTGGRDHGTNEADRRWPRSVYGVGTEPDPRFSFANERTFLAWIRTGLGFLTAGIAIAALSRVDERLSAEVRLASVLLVVCGLACAGDAWFRWARSERAMREGRALPSSPLLLVLVGVLVAVALVALAVLSFE